MLISVKINNNLPKWSGDTNRQLGISLTRVLTDIDRISKDLSPKDTRALANSTRIDLKSTSSGEVSVNVPYAKRRHYENRKNPQTLGYLKKAGDYAGKNGARYFR
jgi:hypothetical protein